MDKFFYKFATWGAPLLPPPAKVFHSEEEAMEAFSIYSERCHRKGFSPSQSCADNLRLIKSQSKAALKKYDFGQPVKGVEVVRNL